MWYTNTLRFEMVNKDSAVKALEAIKRALQNGDFDREYRGTPSEELIKDLIIKDNEIVIADDNKGYFDPEDSLPVFEKIVRNVFAACGNDFRKMFGITDSEYSQAYFEAEIKAGEVVYKTTYYPLGYLAYISCDNCGADAIRLDDYATGQRVICPICGEDITEAIEAYLPQINEVIIK